jgi:hypothetical protein
MAERLLLDAYEAGGATAQKTERPLSDAYEAVVSGQIWVRAFPISACALARFGCVPLPISAGALARFGQKCPGMAIFHPITTPPPPSFHGGIHLPFRIGLFYFWDNYLIQLFNYLFYLLYLFILSILLIYSTYLFYSFILLIHFTYLFYLSIYLSTSVTHEIRLPITYP